MKETTYDFRAQSFVRWIKLADEHLSAANLLAQSAPWHAAFWCRQAAERYLRDAGIVPHERLEISSLAAIAMLVARGVGVSIAPDAASAWWPTLPVARLPLPNSSGARCFGVLWSRTSPRTRAIDVLVDHARRVMEERTGPTTSDSDRAIAPK